MKFYYKRKFFGSEHNYLLLVNEQGEKKYDFKWRGLFVPYLQILDLEKHELARIKREKGLLPHYGVYIREEKVFDLKKEFHPLLPKHVLEGQGWTVKDKYMLHEYDALVNGNHAMTVQNCSMSWGESCEIDIAEGVNELYAICVSLAMDVCCNGQNFLKAPEHHH